MKCGALMRNYNTKTPGEKNGTQHNSPHNFTYFFSTKEIGYSACKAVVLQVMVALIQYYRIFILFFEISQYEHYNLLYGL